MPVPCERDGFCYITHKDPEDEDEPMVLPPVGEFVAGSWSEIISISRLERIEYERNKKHYIRFVPTLEKLESWMDNQEWDSCPIDRGEFFRLVSIFHAAHVNRLVR